MRSIGIDFSGARDAGRKCFIAEIDREANGACCLISIRAGHRQVGSEVLRDVFLESLVEWLGQRSDAYAEDVAAGQDTRGYLVVGLDFPFGVLREMMDGLAWFAWAKSFAMRYEDADDFQKDYHQRGLASQAGMKEPRRVCDAYAKTPFAPANRWMYKQTYHGIRDLLVPLASRGASVAPMMSIDKKTRLVLLETCPASSLKWLGDQIGQQNLATHYKGNEPVRRKNRSRLIDLLRERCGLRLTTRQRRQLIDQTGGDALDAVICAMAAGQWGAGTAGQSLPGQSVHAVPEAYQNVAIVEGWVYQELGLNCNGDESSD